VVKAIGFTTKINIFMNAISTIKSYGWSMTWLHELVGGIPIPLKHMKVSWDDYPILWKIKSMAISGT
jgi:hypothetical protein